MSRYDETTDLYWTNEGDFLLGENGDLEDTRDYKYRGMIQRINTHMQSSQGDWLDHPSVGASLQNSLGKQNTRENAELLADRVRYSLVTSDVLDPGELNIDVYPSSETSVAIVLIITPSDVGRNLFLTYTYDLRDNRMIPRNT